MRPRGQVGERGGALVIPETRPCRVPWGGVIEAATIFEGLLDQFG
jgi:hypothetical protein